MSLTKLHSWNNANGGLDQCTNTQLINIVVKIKEVYKLEVWRFCEKVIRIFFYKCCELTADCNIFRCWLLFSTSTQPVTYDQLAGTPWFYDISMTRILY